MSTHKYVWDMPKGEIFAFQDKADVVVLINKLMLDSDTLPLCGIRLRDDIESENSQESEYVSGYKLPVFNGSMSSSAMQIDVPVIGYIVDDLIFDDKWWSFPCKFFIWIEDDYTRLGATSLFIWRPISHTVSISTKFYKENAYADRWINNMEYHLNNEKLALGIK